MKLRSYQQECLNQALAFYKTGKVFRINACTSAGKTVTANAIANQMGKNVVFVCHTNNLKDQLQARIQEDYVKLFNKKPPSTYQYYTYQSLVKKTKKDLPSIDLLVVDEAHQGGLEKEEKLGSYRQIMKVLKPKKVLALSATDYGLDKDLFGEKTKENTFQFTYKDAMAHNVLNNVDLITIHTGLKQFISSGEVLEGDRLENLKQKDIQKGVDLRAEETKNSLIEGLLLSAAEVYMRRECDFERGIYPQAVFFVGDVDQAEKLRKHLLNRLLFHTAKNPSKKPTADRFVRMSHSKDVRLAGNIEDFKKGLFSCLINVRQVQEGFDYPKLELIFDCAPSTSNQGRVFFQRLGRCVRICEGKGRSRYYSLYRMSNSRAKFDGTAAAKDNLDVTDPLAAEARNEHISMVAEAGLHMANEGGDDLGYADIEICSGSLDKPESIPAGGLYDEVLSFLKDGAPKDDKKDLVEKIYLSRSRFIVNKTDGEREIQRRDLFSMLVAEDGVWNSFNTVAEFVEWIRGQDWAEGCEKIFDWHKRHQASYGKALKLGVQREVAEILGWDVKGSGDWNSFTTAKEFVGWIKKQKEIFKGCESLKEWSRGHGASYKRATLLKITKEIAEELGWEVAGSGVWNSFTTVPDFVGWIKKEKEIFKGCESLKEWSRRHPRSYERACKRLKITKEIADVLGWDVKGSGDYFTFKTPQQFADWMEKQDWFKGVESPVDWKRSHYSSYSKACRLGIQNQIFDMLGLERIQDPQKKKNLYILDALGGKHKPNAGSMFSKYTCKNDRSYDAEFTNIIKNIRPEWLNSPLIEAEATRQEILRLAESGAPKPQNGTQTYSKMQNYMALNVDFKKNLQKLRPDWFVTRTDKKTELQKIILKKAELGGERPRPKDDEYHRFQSWVGKNHANYDKPFHEKLKKIRPDWFQET